MLKQLLLGTLLTLSMLSAPVSAQKVGSAPSSAFANFFLVTSEEVVTLAAGSGKNPGGAVPFNSTRVFNSIRPSSNQKALIFEVPGTYVVTFTATGSPVPTGPFPAPSNGSFSLGLVLQSIGVLDESIVTNFQSGVQGELDMMVTGQAIITVKAKDRLSLNNMGDNDIILTSNIGSQNRARRPVAASIQIVQIK